jgi:hypothetical protein
VQACGLNSLIAVTIAQRVESFYSLRSKMKVMFGSKLRYEIKGTFGETSLKLRPTYWNVARIGVNVVDDELLSHTTIYTCSIIFFGLDRVDAHQRGLMRFGVIHPKWRASSEIGAKSFRLYYGHP